MPSTNAPTLNDTDVVEAEILSGLPAVRHAFFTRRGGASRGIYATLNGGIGSEDDADAVRTNRARMTAFLGLPDTELTTPWQVHSTEAVIVNGPFEGERPRADGIVTRRAGLAVAVVTADCGPILFADPESRVVGAAHAGWRGATGGVIEATIEAMERCGAERANIVAVLGPTITQSNYEIDAAMAEDIVRTDGEAEPFFAAGKTADKRQFDLPGLIVSRLRRASVASADFVGRCTYGEEDSFFSYRRTTHRGEPDYGRQLSAIALV